MDRVVRLTFRAATFVFTYPGDIAQPSLLKNKSEALENLIRNSRSARLTPDAACTEAETYSAYFHDMASLEVQATCQADTIVFEGVGCERVSLVPSPCSTCSPRPTAGKSTGRLTRPMDRRRGPDLLAGDQGGGQHCRRPHHRRLSIPQESRRSTRIRLRHRDLVHPSLLPVRRDRQSVAPSRPAQPGRFRRMGPQYHPPEPHCRRPTISTSCPCKPRATPTRPPSSSTRPTATMCISAP